MPGRIFHGSCSAACRANSARAPARGSRAAREGRRPCGLGPLGAGTQENNLQLSPPGAQLRVPGFTPDHLSGSLNWPDDYSDIEIFHWGGERGVRKETRGEEKDLPGRTKLESTPVTDADSALAPACACVHVCAPTACAGAGLAPAPTSRTPVWARSPRSSPVLGPLSRLGPPTCWQLSGVRLQHRRATGDFSAALSEAEFLLPAPDMIFLSPCKVAALRFRLPQRDTRLAPDTHPLLEPQSFPPPTPRSRAYPARRPQAPAPAPHRHLAGRLHTLQPQFRSGHSSAPSPQVSLASLTIKARATCDRAATPDRVLRLPVLLPVE